MSSTYWTTKGINLADQGNHKAALGAFYWAVKKEPNSAHLWFNISWCLTNVGNFKEASIALKRAIEIDPNFANAWYNLGDVLDQLGRYGEASIAYQKAIILDPQKFGIYDLKSHLQSSIQNTKKKLEINPFDTLSLFNLGIFLTKDENYLDAVQVFDNIIKLEPNHARAWYMKGVVLSKIEKYIDAICAFNKAIEIDPDYERAREKRALINKNFQKIIKKSHDDNKILNCTLFMTDPKKSYSPYITLKNLESLKLNYFDFQNHEEYLDYLMGYDWITTLLIEEIEYDTKTPKIYYHDFNEAMNDEILDVSDWFEFGEDGESAEKIDYNFWNENEDYKLSEEISETDSIMEYYRELYEDFPGDEEGYQVSENDEEPEDLERTYRDDCSAFNFSNIRDVCGQNRDYKYFDD